MKLLFFSESQTFLWLIMYFWLIMLLISDKSTESFTLHFVQFLQFSHSINNRQAYQPLLIFRFHLYNLFINYKYKVLPIFRSCKLDESRGTLSRSLEDSCPGQVDGSTKVSSTAGTTTPTTIDLLNRIISYLKVLDFIRHTFLT